MGNKQITKLDILINLRNEALAKSVVGEVQLALAQSERDLFSGINPDINTTILNIETGIENQKRNIRFIDKMIEDNTLVPSVVTK